MIIKKSFILGASFLALCMFSSSAAETEIRDLEPGPLFGGENSGKHRWNLVFGSAVSMKVVPSVSGSSLSLEPVDRTKDNGSGIVSEYSIGLDTYVGFAFELSRHSDTDGHLATSFRLVGGQRLQEFAQFELWGEGDGVALINKAGQKRAISGPLPTAAEGSIVIAGIIDRDGQSMNVSVNGLEVVRNFPIEVDFEGVFGLYWSYPRDWNNAVYLHGYELESGSSVEAATPDYTARLAGGFTPAALVTYAKEEPSESAAPLALFSQAKGHGVDAWSIEESYSADDVYPGFSVIHVDAASNVASPDGSEAKPFARLADAVQNLQPGTVVSLAPGVYREKVKLEVSGTPSQPIVIRSSEIGKAVISGADIVEGWESLGGGLFRKQLENFDPGWDNHFLRTQWLFRDGQPLRRWEFSKLSHGATTDHNKPVVIHPYVKIEKPEELDYNTFTIDQDTGELFLKLESGDDPAQSYWEIGRRQGLVTAPKPIDNIIIEGLVFDKNSGWWRGEPALYARGQDWIIRNNKFTWSSADALHLGKTARAYVGHNLFEWSGKMAVGSSASWQMVFEHNVIRYSNWMPVDRNWEAGSTKFSTTLDSFFYQNHLSYAYGGGLWLDVYNSSNYMLENTIHDHAGGIGIFSELSWHDVYERNLAYRNDTGFAMGQSSGTTALNNVLADNFTGIQIWGGYRRPSMMGRPEYLAKFTDRVAAIPGMSPVRAAVFRASMERYYFYTDMLPQILGTMESNIVFDNDWNYVEDRNYVTQNEGPISIWDNSFSERNIWWHDDPERTFAANFRKFSYGGFEAWKEASGRDSTSTFEDPRSDDFVAPKWAEEMMKEVKEHALTKDALDSEDQLDMQMYGSAMAAVARSRIATADEVIQVQDLPHSEARAYLYRNGETWSLLSYTTWRVAKEAAKPVKINLGLARVSRESGFLVSESVESLDGVYLERLNHVPAYYHGVDPSLVSIR